MRPRNPARVEANESLQVGTGLPKCPIGIRGLDEITSGGLPRGRPTLVCGTAGCGKTLLGIEFLVRGAVEFGEPGVCISFEESVGEITSNTKSLGFQVESLIARKLLLIDHVELERSMIEVAGDWDLEALFARIGHAVDSIGAKRVLIDSVEALFAGLDDESILRAELRRLFRWLKDRGLTAIVTGERGEGMLTRHGLEEYVSDCVIVLDHEVVDSVLTRRLRVVKYRGSTHGTNAYPFLIDNGGITVLPITSVELKYGASNERISSGVPALDEMFGGEGYFRASSILVSGTAGTGKTSLAAHFVNAGCARGERCAYFSFEESPDQILRNMRSIGIDLDRWVKAGLLRFQSSRPTSSGLELHLVKIHKTIVEFNPTAVVVDPVTALAHAGSTIETQSMLLRMVDYLKGRGVTTLLTTLTGGPMDADRDVVNISSLVDTWLQLRDIETGGERNRGLFILKSRGVAHSNQIREFLLTNQGIELREVYLGEAGLLTGSARLSQESRDASEALLARQELERRELLLERKRRALEAQIAALQLELETETQESRMLAAQADFRVSKLAQDRSEMATSRSAGQRPAARGANRKQGRRA